MSEVQKNHGSTTKLLSQKPSKKPSMKKWHPKMAPSKNLVNQSKKSSSHLVKTYDTPSLHLAIPSKNLKKPSKNLVKPSKKPSKKPSFTRCS